MCVNDVCCVMSGLPTEPCNPAVAKSFPLIWFICVCSANYPRVAASPTLHVFWIHAFFLTASIWLCYSLPIISLHQNTLRQRQKIVISSLFEWPCSQTVNIILSSNSLAYLLKIAVILFLINLLYKCVLFSPTISFILYFIINQWDPDRKFYAWNVIKYCMWNIPTWC